MTERIGVREMIIDTPDIERLSALFVLTLSTSVDGVFWHFDDTISFERLFLLAVIWCFASAILVDVEIF